MRIVMREACSEKDKGSMGAQYVRWAAEGAGFAVEQDGSGPCDIELVSVHSVRDYDRVSRMPKVGLRIIGGHPCAVNPRPLIPFADVICVGEGESWIISALTALSKDLRPEACAGLPGTIISASWENGSPIPKPNQERPIPPHPAYLNRSGDGHARVWYLEMARGCPYSCHYCELGNTLSYRTQHTQHLLEQVDAIDVSQSNRVSLFAPDEASHPGYGEVLQRIHDRGLITGFGSMRIEQVLRKNLPLKANMLIRVGMDGLTEETRFRVGRKQDDAYFVDYFRTMSERGHANFKLFMIVGYPWETAKDADTWFALMSRIGRIERRANAHLRIKITPLIPQPGTPLADVSPRYDHPMISRIENWVKAWRPRNTPGWFFAQDGTVMNELAWRKECLYAAGDESTLLRRIN